MSIPAAGSEHAGNSAGVSGGWTVTDPEREWAALDADAKRERLLCAAGQVFARDGLDAPMPAVAAAAGAGIASVYRQFASKHDLLAALVTRRLELIEDAARVAGARDGDRWSALTGMLWTIVARQSADDFLGEAWIAVIDHPDVVRTADRATRALERLLARARGEGRLRSDATTLDLRLLFAATRAAKQVEPQAWQRMLELLIDALDTKRGECATRDHDR
ncbi:MAG: TetR family transcriptional regulator [Solirubrobacteraceae bacterium]|jgi:AcrR family transcriptional regulator